MDQLRVLDLGDNFLTGKVPLGFSDMVNLQSFNIRYNRLTGAAPLLSSPFLSNFFIDGNSFTGALQDIMEMLPTNQLQFFFIDSNQNISGTIPNSIGNFASLVDFSIAANSIEGTLPSEIGRMVNLKQLFAESNRLGGTFPTEIANIDRLSIFSVHDNNLSGSLEQALCSQNSRFLDLATSDCASPVLVECSCCTDCWSRDGQVLLAN